MEKNLKKNRYVHIHESDVHMYNIYILNQFLVHQKLTQHCKSTALQLKKSIYIKLVVFVLLSFYLFMLIGGQLT